MSSEEPAGLFAAPLLGGRVHADGASLVLVEWQDPGGGANPPRYIAPLHVHHLDDEAWYVVEGALTVRVGERDFAVPAGGAVLVPRGTPHTYWNPQPGPTRYVLAMTAQIAALIDALHRPGATDPDTIAATFEAYASQYLGWP